MADGEGLHCRRSVAAKELHAMRSTVISEPNGRRSTARVGLSGMRSAACEWLNGKCSPGAGSRCSFAVGLAGFFSGDQEANG